MSGAATNKKMLPASIETHYMKAQQNLIKPLWLRNSRHRMQQEKNQLCMHVPKNLVGNLCSTNPTAGLTKKVTQHKNIGMDHYRGAKKQWSWREYSDNA